MDEWFEGDWLDAASGWAAGAVSAVASMVGRAKKGPRRPKNIRRHWFDDKEEKALAAKRKTGNR